MNPQDAWKTALNELEVQLDRANFDTWLRGTVCLDFAPSVTSEGQAVFTIGVRNSFARDMLQQRLYRSVRRVLSDAYGQPVEVRFEHHKTQADSEVQQGNDGEMPLFRLLSQQNILEAATAAPLHQSIARPQRPDLPESELNPRYTFERFVVNGVNNLTYSAAQAVAENPASVYNPLLIYGGVGLGKTHLLQAVGHACRAKNLNVLYVPSEAFINDLVKAIRQRTTAMFREKYRSVDVLLMDDIQFIAGKESTQEEFFHTFNALYTFNKQIVLASDQHPRYLETLEGRLRSRFEGGLLMDVQMPEYETRIAILEMWAQERNVRIPRAVCERIAERTRSNMRELEGLFTQIVAKLRFGRHSFTLADAETVLERYDQPRDHGRKRLSLDYTLEQVARHFDLDVDDLTGKSRAGRINHARQIAMYFARDLVDASLPQIGDALGGRSHTTVLHGYNKVSEMMNADERFRYEMTALREELLATRE